MINRSLGNCPGILNLFSKKVDRAFLLLEQDDKKAAMLPLSVIIEI
jgi:hypothetical protein